MDNYRESVSRFRLLLGARVTLLLSPGRIIIGAFLDDGARYWTRREQRPVTNHPLMLPMSPRDDLFSTASLRPGSIGSNSEASNGLSVARSCRALYDPVFRHISPLRVEIRGKLKFISDFSGFPARIPPRVPTLLGIFDNSVMPFSASLLRK